MPLLWHNQLPLILEVGYHKNEAWGVCKNTTKYDTQSDNNGEKMPVYAKGCNFVQKLMAVCYVVVSLGSMALLP